MIAHKIFPYWPIAPLEMPSAQLFITTRRKGQGTGVGLSLSYDIIKASRSEIKVETKENKGTTFIIQLSTL